MARELGRKATQQAISTYVAEADIPLAAMPPVTGLVIERVHGSRKPLDFLFRWQHEHGETLVPVNLKAREMQEKSDPKNLALSLRELLRWLTQADHDLRQPPRKGPTADGILVELVAGQRKLVPGRDYYLLVIDTDHGHLSSWRWHGLISQVKDDGCLAISRHASRDNVLHVKPQRPIAEDADLRLALIEALLPVGSVARVRSEILAASSRGKRRDLARRLQEIPDAGLMARITQSLVQ